MIEDVRARARANDEIHAVYIHGDDTDEILAHANVADFAADQGAFAEADGNATAMVITPFNSTTFSPEVDATYMLRAVASENAAIGESGLNESNIDAAAFFTAEAPDMEPNGFLHGSYISQKMEESLKLEMLQMPG